MSKVDEALTEIQGAIIAMAPAHEGLRDYARLNITEPTRAVVNAEIARYDQRLAHLEYTANALQGLINNGHPDLTPAEIPQDALEDLQANKTTIDAALSVFRTNNAADLSLKAGEPTEK